MSPSPTGHRVPVIVGPEEAGPVVLVARADPHFSLSERERLAALCHGRTKNPALEIVVTCGHATQDRFRATDVAGVIAERTGMFTTQYYLLERAPI